MKKIKKSTKKLTLEYNVYVKKENKMNFDKWFNSQSRLVQVILFIIPVVGWIVEILVRLSAFLRKQSGTNLIGLLLFVFLGWAWLPVVIDLVYLILKGKFILTE